MAKDYDGRDQERSRPAVRVYMLRIWKSVKLAVEILKNSRGQHSVNYN
jgi:hypothetical protein